jgi:hypothetical protein
MISSIVREIALKINNRLYVACVPCNGDLEGLVIIDDPTDYGGRNYTALMIDGTKLSDENETIDLADPESFTKLKKYLKHRFKK